MQSIHDLGHFLTPLPLHLLSIKMIEPPDLSMDMMDSVRDKLSPSDGVKPEPSQPSTTAAILKTPAEKQDLNEFVIVFAHFTVYLL